MDQYFNIQSSVSTREGFGPVGAQAAGTINGAAIDRYALGLPMSCVLRHAVGAPTGAPSAINVTAVLQHSDDGSTGWTAFGTGPAALTAGSTSAEAGINLRGAKQFVRVVETVAFTGGTTPTIPVAATLVFGGAQRLPAP